MSDRYLGWLEANQTQLPQIATHLTEFGDYYQRRLWHQLTIALEQRINQPEFQRDASYLPELYDKFIAGFAYRLNPLKLAKIAVVVSKQYSQADKAVAFLEDVSERIKETKQPRLEQPLLFLRLQIAQVKLNNDDLPGCTSIIDQGKDDLEAMHDVDPDVSAAYYFSKSLLHKQQKNFAEFYKSSLLYLAFISSEGLPQDVKLSLAVDISLAALLGDNVYNFGELLLHPLIKVLDDSAYKWLHEMLNCFNDGDMHKYDRLCTQYASVLNKLPSMVKNERKLREKITILALTELIFKLPADKRTISLGAISERTKLDKDGVEFLLMKALSLKLIKGTIDEVQQTVQVSWVQPRVLTMPQITALNERLGDWISKVSAATLTLEAESMAIAV